MDKKYGDKLRKLLKEREKTIDYHGAPVLVKNLPDCDEPGAMDPRLYEDMKGQLRLLALMPSNLIKMDVSEKGVQKYCTRDLGTLSLTIQVYIPSARTVSTKWENLF